MKFEKIKFEHIFSVIAFSAMMSFFFYVASHELNGRVLGSNIGSIVTGLVTMMILLFNHYYKQERKNGENNQP